MVTKQLLEGCESVGVTLPPAAKYSTTGLRPTGIASTKRRSGLAWRW